MTGADLARQLEEAQETIRALREELAQTNSGLLALTMELEDRVAERTAELRAAQEELAQTNRELIQLTAELEDRVMERTAELRAKDEELRSMSQQLWQAGRLAAVGELAASIAHELNNPMGIVALRVESLLSQVPAGDQKRRSLTIIEQEIDRMANLVSNLLEFSRRTSVQISSLDVRDEIEKTLELVHYHLRKHGISIERDYDPRVPLIHADRQQLRQLLLNLLTNASDAMPEGGTLTLRVGLEGSCGDPADGGRGGRVTVEVADTGVGIAPENLARVQEPFFTTKPEGKGTGLGLAICRRIVSEHRGSLEIASQVGRGTTVRITLPVAARSSDQHHLREP